MRLEGSLDAFSLPDIFQLLSFTKKSGGLHLTRAGVHGVVHFSTGSVTGGSPDLSVQALVRRLAGSGLVGNEALAAGAGLTGADAARAVLSTAKVDEGALREIAGETAVDAVFDLLRWPDGDFSFVVDEENPLDTGLSITVDDALAEARRRLEIWEAAAAVVPGPDAVLTMPLVPTGDLSLSADEWAALALVDGRRTVMDLVALTGRGQFSVVTTLAGLVERGLLIVDDARGGGVDVLLERHRQLSALEAGTTAATDPAASLLGGESLTMTTGLIDTPAPDASAGAALVSEPVVEEYAAEAEPVGARAEAAIADYDPTEVIPARPEPFTPRRRPEHPESHGHTTVTQVIGSTAMAAETVPSAALIERDPSVNKSLLLRLIAGVRGL